MPVNACSQRPLRSLAVRPLGPWRQHRSKSGRPRNATPRSPVSTSCSEMRRTRRSRTNTFDIVVADLCPSPYSSARGPSLRGASSAASRRDPGGLRAQPPRGVCHPPSIEPERGTDSASRRGGEPPTSRSLARTDNLLVDPRRHVGAALRLSGLSHQSTQASTPRRRVGAAGPALPKAASISRLARFDRRPPLWLLSADSSAGGGNRTAFGGANLSVFERCRRVDASRPRPCRPHTSTPARRRTLG